MRVVRTAVLFLIAAALPAQTFRGNIGGVVTDATGATIAGASVKLDSPATGLTRDEAEAAAGRRWEGAGRMSIVTAAGRDGGRYAILRVSDAGPGIERQYLPRLSERFYRVDPGRGLRPGTGLGLAIVKHVIQRHRGELLVESIPGKGAAFGVVLPMPAP